jgi:hypothetical protein
VAQGLGAALAWMGAALLRPAIQQGIFLLRGLANLAVRALFRPALSVLMSVVLGSRALLGWGQVAWRDAVRWVARSLVGPARQLLGALTSRLLQPATRQLLRAFARLWGLLAGGAAWLASGLAWLLSRLVVQPLRWIGWALGWAALIDEGERLACLDRDCH